MSAETAESHRSHKVTEWLAGGLLVALAVGAVAGVYKAGEWVWGDEARHRTEEEMLAEARQQFIAAYDESSASQQLAILYAGSPFEREISDGLMFAGRTITVLGNEGGSRLNGLLSRNFGDSRTEDYTYTFGQACLAGTGYDTTPSELIVRGGGGSMSAVATVNADPVTGNLSISPASGIGDTLHFEPNAQGIYLASDENTAATLDAYGCDPAYNPLVGQPIGIETS